ncbi:hypothetical protein [Cupriavidus necator]
METPVSASQAPSANALPSPPASLFSTQVNEPAAPPADPGFAWRWANNVAAIVGRNVVSVGVPTFARELGRRGIAAPLLTAAGPTASYVSGSMAALLPLAYQLGGLYRDANAGTQTVASLSSRVANIMLLGSTFTALAATGHLVAAAPALLAANLIYTPLRDMLQYGLRLSDNNPGLSLPATVVSAGLYGVNQTLVGQGMDMAASALRPYVGEMWSHALGRAAINVLGETADELSFRVMTSAMTNDQPLQITLAGRPRDEWTVGTALDQLLVTHAGRSTLFASAFSMAYAAQREGWAGHGVVGGTLAGGYVPFIYLHDRAPARAVHEQGDFGIPLLDLRRLSGQADHASHPAIEATPGGLQQRDAPPAGASTQAGVPPQSAMAAPALAGVGGAALVLPQPMASVSPQPPTPVLPVPPTAGVGEVARSAPMQPAPSESPQHAGPVPPAVVPDAGTAAPAATAAAVPAQGAAAQGTTTALSQAALDFQARYAHLQAGGLVRGR